MVDEAHETSFKQEEAYTYHARDVAVMRGMFERCPVVLASATPAIETPRHQVEVGRYAELKLPGRYGAAELPRIEAIDLITRAAGTRPLAGAPVGRGHRGDAEARRTVALVPQPPRLCAADALPALRPPLPVPELHGMDGRAPAAPPPVVPPIAAIPCRRRACAPSASPTTLWSPAAPDVERIADEVAALWPEARTAIVTSDTLWSPAKAAEFVSRMEHGAIDIVVGTQLVTKGYHFPNLTWSAWSMPISGSTAATCARPNAPFSRSCRSPGAPGAARSRATVFIQTHAPEARVMQAPSSGDAEAFYAAETEARRHATRRLSAVMPRSSSPRDKAAAEETARMIGRSAPESAAMHVYGPAPRTARDAARATSLPPAGPRQARLCGAGCDPRLAGRAQLDRAGARGGGRGPV